MIHYLVLLSFGVTSASILMGTERTAYAWICSLVVFCLVLFRLLYSVKKPLLVMVTSFMLGISIFQYVQSSVATHDSLYDSGFIYKDKTTVSVSGNIVEFPSYKFSNNQYILQVPNSNTRILVITQPYQKFGYLDSLVFDTKVQDVRSQGEEWEGYYRKLNVQYSVLYPNSITATQASPENPKQRILHKLFAFKNYLRTKTFERFSSHASALVLGMLLGEKDELSKEEKAEFTQANLSHILVVSGYNISIVLSFIFIILKSTHRYLKTTLGLACVLSFVLLVGLDASIIRSALMGSIVTVAQIFYRKSSATHTLFLVATVMLLINPLAISDPGFHLSFLATYSLIILPDTKKIPEYILTTLWVSGFVSAYIMYLSGTFSFVGIVINILVLFCVPIFMLVSALSLVLSSVNVSLYADVFILEGITRYIFLMTRVAEAIESIEFKIAPHVAVLFYVLILGTLSFFDNRYTTSEFIEKQYRKFVPQKPS